MSEGGSEPLGSCGPSGSPQGGGPGGFCPPENGEPQFQDGGLPPPSPGPPLLPSPPSPPGPPPPRGFRLGGIQFDDWALDGCVVVATRAVVVVVVVVATPLAGAVPESKLYGQAFEEALAPDTDPIVFVGAPVGRSEPIAFADRFVTAVVTGLGVRWSICCVVKTPTLLRAKSKFLTLLCDCLLSPSPSPRY